MGSEIPTIVVASPFEDEHVARVIAAVRERALVVNPVELLPPMRFVADHHGPADFKRSNDDQQRWLNLLASAEVLFGLPEDVTADLLSVSPKLKWLQGTSAGMGQPAVKLNLINSDVIVTTASGVHSGALSEFVFGALLGHVKQFAMLADWQRDHQWEHFTAGELSGKTMTIIGPGRIGRQIARVAKVFDMQVVAVGRTGSAERAPDLGVDLYFTTDQLHLALKLADVVVITTPHTNGTDHLIGEAEFAVLKPGVWFVNIGRGAVVDEPVLIERLRDGSIGFAALDVFATEPLPSDSPLWDMPNVVISPHCSANAPRENERITDIFVRNLPLYLDGKFGEMSPVLNKEQLY